MLNINIDKKGQQKEHALKEADDAKKRANTSEKSEHNTEHKTERTPNNRAKPKQRAGASPKKSPGKLQPFPTGEPASGSQDQPEYDNPESNHEPKGDPGRPRNTQDPQPKTTSKASSVRQEAFTQKKANTINYTYTWY